MDSMLTEDEVKKVINDYFRAKGFTTSVAWGNRKGEDIVAVNDNSRIVIEVKGCGSRDAMRTNYFLAVLGEILQRMSDENAKYYIAFPNIKQFRNLWQRLPAVAKNRIKVNCIFVDKDSNIEFVN